MPLKYISVQAPFSILISRARPASHGQSVNTRIQIRFQRGTPARHTATKNSPIVRRQGVEAADHLASGVILDKRHLARQLPRARSLPLDRDLFYSPEHARLPRGILQDVLPHPDRYMQSLVHISTHCVLLGGWSWYVRGSRASHAKQQLVPRVPARMEQPRVATILDAALVPMRPVAINAREVSPAPELAQPLLEVQQLREADVRRLELVRRVVGPDALPLEVGPVSVEVVVSVLVETVLVCCVCIALRFSHW